MFRSKNLPMLSGCLGFFLRIYAVFVLSASTVLATEPDANTKSPNPCANALQNTTGFPAKESGIGYRGFLTGYPPFEVQNFRIASERGLLEWNIPVFVVKNEGDLLAHDAQTPMPLEKGLYVVTDQDLRAMPTEHAAQKFDELTTKNGIFYVLDGQLHRATPEFVRERFSLESDRLVFEPGDQPRFIVRGWFYPKVRGVIHAHDTNGSTYSRIRAHAAKLVSQGYKIKFSSNFPLVLQSLAKHIHRGNKVNQISRFADPVIQEAMTALYQDGKIFTVELWDPKGELVAANLNIRSGNIVSGDSVFYHDIDHGKILDLALIDRVYAAGIDWIDIQTVSGFSKNLKGRLITIEKYEEIGRMLRPANIDLESEWTPRKESPAIILRPHSPSYDLIGPAP